jgi:hypothetical protein
MRAFAGRGDLDLSENTPLNHGGHREQRVKIDRCGAKIGSPARAMNLLKITQRSDTRRFLAPSLLIRIHAAQTAKRAFYPVVKERDDRRIL